MTTTHTPRTTFVTFAKVSTYASFFLLYSLAVITSVTLCALSPAYTEHVGKAFQASVRKHRVQQELPPRVITYTQDTRIPLVEAVQVVPAQCIACHNQTGIEVGIIQPEEAWVKLVQVGT